MKILEMKTSITQIKNLVENLSNKMEQVENIVLGIKR
jgi:hypothetical protein